MAILADKVRKIIIKKEFGHIDEKDELEDQDTLEESSKDQEADDEEYNEGKDSL